MPISIAKEEKNCKIVYDRYTVIFLKHVTGIGKTELVEMTFELKIDIKALRQKPFTLLLWHPAWLRHELAKCEGAGIVLPSI